MTLTLVGMGCGSAATLTEEGRQALLQADLLIGASRLLEDLPEGCTSRGGRRSARRRFWSCCTLRGHQRPCVLFSGDTGIHSGASQLLRRLQEMGGRISACSPESLACSCWPAALGRPWQDWNLCSAHGTDCDPVPAVMDGRPAFFLTGGADGPARPVPGLCGGGTGRPSGNGGGTPLLSGRACGVRDGGVVFPQEI